MGKHTPTKPVSVTEDANVSAGSQPARDQPAVPTAKGHYTIGIMALRYLGYGLLMLVPLSLLTVVARRYGVAAFRENQLIESVQLLLIGSAAGLLLLTAWRLPNWRQLLVMLGGLALFAAIRESDYTLDVLLPLGWKGPGLLVLAMVVYVVVRDVHGLGRQVERFMPSAAFGLLWAGLLFVIGCAQLIGHGPLMQTIVGERYDADLKRVLEESLELAGYLLILVGSLETVVWARQHASSPA